MTKESEIQVSKYTESADEFCKTLFEEINSTEGFKNLMEIKDWIEEKGREEELTPIKNIYWLSTNTKSSPEEALGIGFVNTRINDLLEGIYFRDPDWYEGRVCRVNNQYDIALFILAARELRELDVKGEVFLSTLE